MTVVELSHVSKHYLLGVERVAAVSDITLRICARSFTVLSGPSGSGKSTLLNLIGCIDRPDDGYLRIGGETVQNWTDTELTAFRASHIGFIFQNFNLLPVLSAWENVEYPLLLAGTPAADRRRRVDEMLDAVGLSDKARHRPNQLSGGQCQRVAIARALIHQPDLILADEPTANLDSQTAMGIITLMRDLQRERDTSFVFSSHDPMLISQADELVQLRDGRIVPPDSNQASGAPR